MELAEIAGEVLTMEPTENREGRGREREQLAFILEGNKR